MKTSILSIAALLFITTGYAQFWENGETVKGNGKVTTVTRTTGDYEGISCAGSFDYILVAGNEGNITIEGEENLLKYVVTEVKNNKLHVKTEKNYNLKPSGNRTIKITIPFKDISSVGLAGDGKLTNKDKIVANDFKVSLAGSGDIVLDIEVTSVKASIAGSGDLTLKGRANDLDANVAGSGDFHGFNLQANNTDVSVAGSGDAEVVSNVSLKARVAGSGDVKYKGNPKTEDTKVAGSGRISN
ncbi:putative autotransporter adhesin-like protein [Flavobacteriaceae bacterium MAR_2010_105]|nr:putative autotransporter adhesin-like protein [Flavobacteriaceae bacterium MAR_2010_105]